jgi:signal peptidase II
MKSKIMEIIKNNLKTFLLTSAIILGIFLVDRTTKIYIINLAELKNIDIYITEYLNFYLVWNQGISFGLFSTDHNFMYKLITTIIIIIIIILIIMLIKEYSKVKRYGFIVVLGGAFGNLFDRMYYLAVPDFIDFHIGDFHWFIFNVADIFITMGVICLIYAEIFITIKK